MQTFLIVSRSNDSIDKKIKSIIKNLSVSPFNLVEINPLTSISISDVRKISQTVLLKPYGGGDRLVILRDIEKATAEASNALLKLLEEPPTHTYIILVTDNMDKLIPTIVSRCQIISVENGVDYKQSDDKETKKILRQILTASSGGRIILSQKIANTREEAIKFLGDLLPVLEKFLHNPDKEINLSPAEIAALIKKVSTAKTYLERYINFKATLDVLFLGFPKLEK